MNKSILKAAVCKAAIIAAASSAHAQQFQSDDVVVVTAQKREQAVTDVPIAIDVVDGDSLRQRGASSLIDVAQYSPGVNIRGPFGDFSYPLITLRGVNADGFIETFSQSTGVYSDGVYLSQPPMLAMRLLDLERMEVLKGPQGTLYGRNTIGGAVNFISKKPTFEPDGYLTAGYGRYNRVSVEGAYGGALSETVAARAAVKYVRQFDSPVRNLNPGVDDGGEIDQLFGRVSLLYAPQDNFDARLEVHAGRDRSDNWPFALIPGGADTDSDGLPDILCDEFARGDVAAAQINCLAADPFVSGTAFNDTDGDPYTNNLNAIGQSRSDSVGASLEMNWDIGRAVVTSLTAWDDFQRVDEVDEDAGPTTALDNVRMSDANQFSQELRIASDSDSTLQWLAGLYFSKDELVGDPSFDQGGRQDFSELDTTTFGVFGQAEAALTDQLTLTAGARWTHVDRSISYQTNSPFAAPELIAGAGNEFQDGDYSVRVALDYDVSDNTLLYASFSRGFNAGAFNSQFLGTLTDLTPTDSESILAYEVGLKTTFADGRASFEAAGYYYDYNDIQLVSVVPQGGLDVNILTNAEGATIKGLEAQLRAAPTAWLDFNVGVSYIDSELGNLVTQISGTGVGSAFPYNAPIFGSSNVQLEGRPLPNHPEWSVNGSVRAVQPVSQNWELFFQTDVLWEDEVPRDLQGTLALFTEAHWNVDAQVGLASTDEMWRLSFWTRNLTNETYITEAYQVLGFGFFIAGANYSYPRTYGFNVTRNF